MFGLATSACPHQIKLQKNELHSCTGKEISKWFECCHCVIVEPPDHVHFVFKTGRNMCPLAEMVEQHVVMWQPNTYINQLSPKKYPTICNFLDEQSGMLVQQDDASIFVHFANKNWSHVMSWPFFFSNIYYIDFKTGTFEIANCICGSKQLDEHFITSLNPYWLKLQLRPLSVPAEQHKLQNCMLGSFT